MSAERTVWPVPRNLSGELWADAIRSASALASHLAVVTEERFPPRRPEVLDRLAAHGEERTRTRSWPGTTAADEHVLHRYPATAETAGILIDAADRLSDWQLPDLPTDPHLVRPDGSELFGVCVCERIAWFVLTREEVRGVPARLQRRLWSWRAAASQR